MSDRAYGTDTTPRYSTLAECERGEDGLLHFSVVILDQSDGSAS